MVSVTARLRAKAGRADELEAMLRELAGEVRANEPGCALYQPARSKHDTHEFVVIERYESDDAQAAHANAEHFRERVAALIECCEGTPEIALFDEL